MTQISTTQDRIDRARSEQMEVAHLEEENYKVVNHDSSTGEESEYIVDVEQMACSCPDHVFRGTTCKHMFAAAEVAGVLVVN